MHCAGVTTAGATIGTQPPLAPPSGATDLWIEMALAPTDNTCLTDASSTPSTLLESAWALESPGRPALPSSVLALLQRILLPDSNRIPAHLGRYIQLILGSISCNISTSVATVMLAPPGAIRACRS